MSIVSAMRKMAGVPVELMNALRERAKRKRGTPERPYEGSLFAKCFGSEPEALAYANRARRRRIGNCYSQRRADEAARAAQ